MSAITEDLRVRLAARDDVDLVVDILREAARWLAHEGIQQWPPDGFPTQTIAERIDRGETFVAEVLGEPVATISVDWADPDMWGDDGSDGKAAYVHRLAVRRHWAGREIGDALLRWAAGRAREAGPGGPPRLRHRQPAPVPLLPRTRLDTRPRHHRRDRHREPVRKIGLV